MKKFEEKTIRTEEIYNGQIINLQVDDVKLPNGATSKRELVKHPGAVAVIPITKDKRIVFVEQYRKPLEKSLIEIPAGKLEKNEDPETTAVRELAEEWRYTTDMLSFITSSYPSPAFADELIHISLADHLHILQHAVPGDDDEFFAVVKLTWEAANQCVKDKRIHDAK